MDTLHKYELTLLQGWEEVHKKSQLSLWILLALKDGKKHMTEIKQFIAVVTNCTISADDKSMYRALRRFHESDMVSFEHKPSKGGPELKVYSLTDTGRRVLEYFTQRNIVNVFYKPEVETIIKKG